MWHIYFINKCKCHFHTCSILEYASYYQFPKLIKRTPNSKHIGWKCEAIGTMGNHLGTLKKTPSPSPPKPKKKPKSKKVGPLKCILNLLIGYMKFVFLKLSVLRAFILGGPRPWLVEPHDTPLFGWPMVQGPLLTMWTQLVPKEWITFIISLIKIILLKKLWICDCPDNVKNP